MAKKRLKTQVKSLKKRVKRLRKLVRVGVKTLDERDAKIAQLTSFLDGGKETKTDQIDSPKRQAA